MNNPVAFIARLPSPDGQIPTGLYELPRRTGEAHLYRLNHPLADAILAQAKSRNLPVQETCFAYGHYEGVITVLEPVIGKSGRLTLSSFTVESLDQAEDHLIFGMVADDGTTLDEDAAAHLFTLPGRVVSPSPGCEGRGEGELPVLADLTRRHCREHDARRFGQAVCSGVSCAPDAKPRLMFGR